MLETSSPALLRDRIPDAVLLPLNLIRPNPWNRKVNDEQLADLADNVRQVGVLQPALVRPIEGAKPGEPLFELIAGERRWRAARQAELRTLPVLVRRMDDQQVIELNLVENLQREDLHPLDEAAGYDRLLRKDAGPQALRGFASPEALAERIGKSRSYVVQRLRLLQLCPEGQQAFRAGRLSFSLALRIARLPRAEDQAKATKAILTGWGGEPMTARQADDLIHREFMLDLGTAVFNITDASLVPEAGSCRECTKRTGCSPDLFQDIKRGDTCTDSACFQAKVAAHQARQRAEAEAKGLQVISGKEAKAIIPESWSMPRGYLELDKVHAQLDGKKTLRKLLGKAELQPVLVQHPRDGNLVPMVPEKAALAALKAAGKVDTARMPKTSAAERDAAAKTKRETAWRMATAAAVAEAARGDAGAAGDYRSWLIMQVATRLWHELHNDTRQRITKLLGWPPLKPSWETGPGVTADEHIRGLNDRELCRYLTVCTIAADAGATHRQPETLLATAAQLGVDVQACKAQARELQRKTPDKAAAKRATQRAGAAEGYTAIADAFKRAKAQPAAKAARPNAARYRCPDTGSTWSGRGLRPAWLRAKLAAGAHLADFDTQASPTPASAAAQAAGGAAPPADAGGGGKDQAPAKAGADMAQMATGGAA